MECAHRCRSKQHALQLVSAVIRGNLPEIQAYVKKCHNYIIAKDDQGRTLLHMAVSCGKYEVTEWLLSEGLGVNPQDYESGWSPLHRALFYGQLACAVCLIQNGASLRSMDHEGLSPLDIAMKDRPAYIEFKPNGLNYVYTWGDNSNFTLGHGSELRKPHPESIDFFRKKKISLKQVILKKYHSVFLTNTGQVYTCGHGQGGRLGHGNEETCLTPHLVTTLEKEVCTLVAAGRDHTVFLLESGTAYTCGMNEYHQLGQYPHAKKSLVPKLINSKLLKGSVIQAITVGRFHTVLLIGGAVHTFGLNAGQLGHPKGEAVQTQPRQVSAFNHKDMKVKIIACSDAATVCITAKGDIYVLHEYLCRKTGSRWLDVKEICVVGGNLEHNSNKGTLLSIVILTSGGKAFIWTSVHPIFRRCSWSVNRMLNITSVALNESGLSFVTNDGEGFSARFQNLPERNKENISPAKAISLDAFPRIPLSELIEQDDFVNISIKRLPSIHRAVSIATDSKGFNYAVLQAHSNASITEVPSIQPSEICNNFKMLYIEADSCDLIHDVLLQVGTNQVPVHKFLLSARSSYFKRILITDPLDQDTTNIVIDNVHKDIFMQLIKFIYTDSCDLLKIGQTFSFSKAGSFSISTDAKSTELEYQVTGRDADYKVYQSTKHEGSKNKKEKELNLGDDPLKVLAELAKRFGVDSLNKKLNAVKYVNGMVQLCTGKSLPSPRLKYDRSMMPSLYDVSLKADDGTCFSCHKCVLVARLEYFHSMLATGWMETSVKEPLSLPVPPSVLKIVLDYLYSDTAQAITGCEDLELLCNLLVTADQLLIIRLRDMCEVELVSLISLKSAAELLEFASVYNASQLRMSCQQFICHNLSAILEARSLDVLSSDVLQELAKYYRDTTPSMCRRIITPFSTGPSSDYLESLVQEESSTVIEIQKKSKSKKKRTRTQSTGAGDSSTMRVRTVSESSEKLMDVHAGNFSAGDGFAKGKADHSLRSLSEITLKLDTKVQKTEGETEDSERLNSYANRVRTISGSLDQPTSPVGMGTGISECTSPIPPSSPRGAAQNVVSLRDIMAEEIKSIPSQKRVINIKIPKLPKKGASKSSNTSKQVIASSEQDSASKSFSWRKVDSVVPSFRDLMISDEETTVTTKRATEHQMLVSPKAVSSRSHEKTHHSLPAISWGLPMRNTKLEPLRVDVQEARPATPPEKSPWSPAASPWSPDSAEKKNARFTDIVQSELQKSARLERATSKPLNLIQIEERAVEELLQHHGAQTNYDQKITVERVKHDIARPLWKAHTEKF